MCPSISHFQIPNLLAQTATSKSNKSNTTKTINLGLLELANKSQPPTLIPFYTHNHVALFLFLVLLLHLLHQLLASLKQGIALLKNWRF